LECKLTLSNTDLELKKYLLFFKISEKYKKIKN